MPNEDLWTIQVRYGRELPHEFKVPCHKLELGALENVLRAIVVHQLADTPETMASYYVNRRRGFPDRLEGAEVRFDYDHEHDQYYYWCGKLPTCLAIAWVPKKGKNTPHLTT
jgi:hypothetical protein